ncbi:MAG: exopolysaccharide biosynthesis polyprenyl glycosylphosphotransferase, partial [Candidatus Limisoma sp.]|nr:exopolysaccharide biosynthesis polyprenyl glycosylphosphotransferase [Candidatus Limisoma sp.]
NEEHADRAMTGTLQEIEDFVVANNIDEIYCAQPSEEENVGDIIKIADRHDVQFFYVPLISGFMTTSFSLTSMGNLPIMVYRPYPLQFWLYRLIKRIFDICFSLVVIALVSVTVLIPIIFAIKLSSRGPVLFKQRRTGYRGREFTCLKFRTMKVNSQADTVQATKDDPRKTRVGDFLRRTSLDELPQFLNVLWGDMSVVGPRPHMVSQTNEYKKLIDKYMVRHIIKPGITGLAQVSGYRGQTEELWQMQKRVEYDVTYIENWSLWLDVKIIIRTIVNAILGEKNAF